MRILDRYLLREITPPFLVGIMVFTFILLMGQFLKLVEMILNKGVPLTTALRLIGYLLPSILVMTLPMAILLGTLVAFGRMTADNEITALRAGGVSLFRLTRPVVLFSLAVWGITAYLIGTALPAANQAFRTLMFEVVRSKASLGLRERVFNDEFDGLILYINQVPVSQDQPLGGIIIHDFRGELEKPRRDTATIFAKEGVLISDDANRDVVFRLREGSIHTLGRDRLKYEQINFGLHDLRLTMDQGLSPELALPKGLREMTVAELRQKAEEFRRQGVSVHPPLVEIQKKYAIPVACLIFPFLGISLGVLFRKGEKMVAFALCIGVVIVYYVILVAGEPLGKSGAVPAWLSMWAANILFSLIAGALYATVVRERPPTLLFRRRPARSGPPAEDRR
jgi:lipopolysaccharide export system permease protein